MLNLVVVIGTLARAPQVRDLPSGYTLASFDLHVARPEQAFEIVPVAIFDPPASVSSLATGDLVLVVGRVRRRFFRVGGSTQSRTEVVADHVVPAGPSEEVASLLAGAGQAISAWVAGPGGGADEG